MSDSHTTAPAEAACHQTFAIPTTNLDTLTSALDRLNRKAITLGLAPMVYVVGDAFMVPRDKNRQGLVISWREVHPVTVESRRISLNGWHLDAVLVASGDQVMVRCIPGASVDPKYRTCDASHCDHCGVTRNRHETFVVRHDNGATRQVGRQCLADFIGHANAAFLAEQAQFIAKLTDAEEDDSAACNRERLYASTVLYLQLVAAVIRLHGWVSSGSATDHRRATKDVATDVYWTKKDDVRMAYAPTEEDVRTAAAARAWALEGFGGKPVNTRSDYEHNAYLSVRGEVMGDRTEALAASVVASYLREQDRLRLRKLTEGTPFNDAYLATEGERVSFYARLLSTKALDSQFGVTTIHRFLTRDGHAVVWFASDTELSEEDEGERLFTATVKKHDDYRGTKQTVVSRLVEARDDKRTKLEAKLSAAPKPRATRTRPTKLNAASAA